MTNFERRQIGNMADGEMFKPQVYETDGRVSVGPSLAEDWGDQGIGFEVTDPVPTEKYSSKQLKDFGKVGVTLVIPKPE